MTEQRPSEIVVDAGALAPDVRAVGALARMQLDARRHGLRIHIRDASVELREIIALCGLGELFADASAEGGRAPSRSPPEV
jgi:anti-anti-sigma regulatory factor